MFPSTGERVSAVYMHHGHLFSHNGQIYVISQKTPVEITIPNESSQAQKNTENPRFYEAVSRDKGREERAIGRLVKVIYVLG